MTSTSLISRKLNQYNSTNSNSMHKVHVECHLTYLAGKPLPFPLFPCSCTCCFPSLLAPPHRLYQGASITAALQIFLSVVLTTALMVRFLLWCRGERRKGLTLICSPIVSLSLFIVHRICMYVLQFFYNIYFQCCPSLHVLGDVANCVSFHNQWNDDAPAHSVHSAEVATFRTSF